MTTRLFAIFYKTAFALLVISAVVAQFLDGRAHGANTANFFSFFTIESNLFAASVMTASAYFWYANRNSRTLDMFRGAAALYMATTGLVYTSLLSGLQASLQTTLPWVNLVLHTLFPLVVLIDWFVDRPSVRIDFKRALLWLIYPLAYVVYSLARGSMTGWYPYPFLNPENSGYGAVALVTIGIFVTSLAITSALTRATPTTSLSETASR